MPGLLNHLTGTLNDIDAMKEETKQLMRTIRLPRKLGQITERMPSSKYEDSVRDKPDSAPTDRNRSESAVEVGMSQKLNRVSSVPAAMRLN